MKGMQKQGESQLDYISYIDGLRAVAIYLVIALHCTVGYVIRVNLFGSRTWWIGNAICVLGHIGVPMFFMISGFLLLTSEKTLDIKGFYRRRFGKLILPFLVWDIIYFLEQCFVNDQSVDIGLFFRELVTEGSRYHLWFIYQIIGIYLLLPFLKKIVDHATSKELIVFLGVVLLQPSIFRFANIIQSYVSFAPFRALVEGYVGFFLMGYLLGTCRLALRGRRIICLLGLLCVIFSVVGNYSMSSPQTMNLFFYEGYCITKYPIGAAIFVFAQGVTPKLSARLLQLQKKLAQLSFGIYFAHVFVLDVLDVLLYRCGIGLSPLKNIAVSFLFVSILTTMGMYCVSKIPVVRRLLM